jgi:predicted DNA-binding transcriptional regulator AlpA
VEKIELLTLAEVADVFSVSRQCVLNWVDAGQFPRPIRISRRYVRWLLADVKAFLEDCKNAKETCQQR